MARFSSAGEFAAELGQLERDMQRRYPVWGAEIAADARKIADKEIAADTGGDRQFSGWPGTIDLSIRPKRYGAVLLPADRLSAGKLTTLTIGRNQGGATGFAGPGINRRTGLTSRTKAGNVRKVRATRSKRWTGYTAGKGTAIRAQERFDNIAVDTAQKRYRLTLKRHFD